MEALEVRDNMTQIVLYCDRCQVIFHLDYDDCPDCGDPLDTKEVK